MKLEAPNEFLLKKFSFSCPLCFNKFNETSNFPMLICNQQHYCCEKCLTQKIFKHVYVNTDIGQCPECMVTVRRSQATRVKIFELFENALNSEKGIELKIQAASKREEVSCAKEEKASTIESLHVKQLQNWLLEEAEAHFLEGKLERCIKICKQLIESNPNCDIQFQGMGNKEDLIGYEEEYIKQFYRKHIQNSEQRSPYDLLSLTLLLSSDYEEDREWFINQLRIEENYKLYFGLGVLEANFGKSDEAIQSFFDSVRLNNTFDKAEQCIAFEYFANGDFEAAKVNAERSLRKNSKNFYSQFIVAMTTEEEQQKIKKLAKLTKQCPQYLVPQYELGQIYQARNQMEKATACFESCLQGSPLYDLVRINLGICYLLDNQPEKAMIILENHSLVKESEEAIEIIAEAYSKVGLLKQAHEMIDRCKKLNPDNEKIDYILANVYEQEEKYDLSIELYKQILKKDPEDSSLYKNIAIAFLKKKDYFNAQEWGEEYFALEPEETEAMIEMADLYFNQKQLQPALKLYLSCFQILQEYKAFASKIIQIYEQKHFFEEALHWARKWNEEQPGNPQTWETLASISKTIGERIRSKEWEPKKQRHLK